MTTGDDVQLVTFRVGGQDFAFNIYQVERILRYETPAPLPKAPAFLEGVMQYQNAPVPVFDLRKRLAVPAPQRDDTRIVILEADGSRIGAVVDTVLEVLQVPASSVTPPPPIVKGLAADFLSGLVTWQGRTILVLNTARLLASAERVQLETALKAGAERAKV